MGVYWDLWQINHRITAWREKLEEAHLQRASQEEIEKIEAQIKLYEKAAMKAFVSDKVDISRYIL